MRERWEDNLLVSIPYLICSIHAATLTFALPLSFHCPTSKDPVVMRS